MRDRQKRTDRKIHRVSTFDFDEDFVEQEIEDTPLEIMDTTITQKISQHHEKTQAAAGYRASFQKLLTIARLLPRKSQNQP